MVVSSIAATPQAPLSRRSNTVGRHAHNIVDGAPLPSGGHLRQNQLVLAL